MSNLTESKAAVIPATQWSVTNHYIKREDHPCFGTQLRTVERVTGSRIYFTGGSYIDWPKAAAIERDADGTIRLFGGGTGQGPTDLFMTLVPAA
jgi:hypothetical protein